MSQHSMTAKCLVFALGTAILLSGCQSTDKAAVTSGQEQVDPALTPAPDNNKQGEGSGEGQGENGSANTDDTTSVTAKLKSEYGLSSTIEQQGDKAVVTNPESILVVVNKERYLPDGYEPPDLVEPNVKFSFEEAHEKRHMRKEAAEALEEMFKQAKEEGVTLHAVSGYRSFKRQESLFSHYVNTQGKEYAARVSAVPGTSEHQTGLTMDLSSPSVGDVLEEVFGDSDEGKWVAEHAHEFGFIIRYPKDGESITGYVYEPWHVRYVGKEAAKAAYDGKLTLEQLLQ